MAKKKKERKKRKEKTTKDYQLFSLFSEFHDKSGESDKNRESGRQHDNCRETLDQIVRVVMSVYASELDVDSDRFENMNW